MNIWEGKFGNDYTDRNQLDNRQVMWECILDAFPVLPKSILEIGANIGLNLDAIKKLTDSELIGLEPNDMARHKIKHKSLDGVAQKIPLPDESVDMAFTCGILIHIHPDELKDACDEIYRVAKKYIVCIEYFSAKPEEIEYRGMKGLLWKRDFGKFWMKNYNLSLIDYGFFWKEATGLDNLTYWIFEK